MPKPGDVVTLLFTSAVASKKRPGIVISSDLYHVHRPDLIIAILTTNIAAATAPTDYVLQDWQAAGLHRPSAFRVYLTMAMPPEVQVIGRLSEPDWQGVRAAVHRAFA